MICVLYAINNGQAQGWGSPLIIGGIVIGILLLSIFMRFERRITDPIIDFDLYKISRFSSEISRLSCLLQVNLPIPS